MVEEVAKHIPDIATFGANVVVFLAAIGAAVAGSMAMVKKIKNGIEETFPSKPEGNSVEIHTQRSMVGALMMETTTAAMLTEAQRQLAEATDQQTDEMRELRIATCALRDELREHRHEMQLQRRLGNG